MAEWIPANGVDNYGSTEIPHLPNTHAIVGLDVKIDRDIAQPNISASQEKAISVICVMCACLSIMGSSTIVAKVLRNRSIASSYDRLMLGLSISDIIASVTYSLWPFLLPAETSEGTWAVGNDATCNFLGFLTQLSFAGMMYNGVLSYYYLITIRFGLKHKELARFERWMHFFAIAFPLVTASLGSAFGIYHELELGFGCGTNYYQEDCEGDECAAYIWGYIFALIPIGFSFGSLVMNNIIIFHHVRRRFHRTDCTVYGSATTSSESSPDTTKSSDPMDDKYECQIKQAAIQSFLYVGTFFFSFWSPLVIFILRHSVVQLDDSQIFPLLMLQSICLPLQGFLNMFVYNRHSFTRLRAAYPNMALLKGFRVVFFGASMPPSLMDVVPQQLGTHSCRNECSDVIPHAENQLNGNSGRCLTSNGSSYFHQHPLEYYNACAQQVLASSVPTTSTRVQTYSSATLSVVDEEEGEDEYGEKEGGNGRHTAMTTSLMITSEAAATIDLDSEDMKEPEVVPTNVDLDVVASTNVRSFRIRMDGALELEEKHEETC